MKLEKASCGECLLDSTCVILSVSLIFVGQFYNCSCRLFCRLNSSNILICFQWQTACLKHREAKRNTECAVNLLMYMKVVSHHRVKVSLHLMLQFNFKCRSVLDLCDILCNFFGNSFFSQPQVDASFLFHCCFLIIEVRTLAGDCLFLPAPMSSSLMLAFTHTRQVSRHYTITSTNRLPHLSLCT